MAIETRSNSILNKKNTVTDLMQTATAAQNNESDAQAPVKPVLSKAEPKTGLLSKIHDTFFQGRNIADVTTGVIKNWLIPSIIDGIATSAKAAIDNMFYGETRQNNSSFTTGLGVNRNPSFYNALTRSTVSGGGIVASGGRGTPQSQGYVNAYRHGFQNVPLPMLRDAELVRDYLLQYLYTYKQVRVADFYDACGDYAAHIFQQYTDNNWGWTNLDNLTIDHYPEGWVIRLPEPISLK